LVNKVVAFQVSSELGKKKIMLLGGSWTESAISHGYIIGVITRKSSLKMQGCNDSLYDVAWEYSDFGETAFASSVLVGAVNAGREIVQLRRQRSPARGIDTCRGHPTLRQKRKKYKIGFGQHLIAFLMWTVLVVLRLVILILQVIVPTNLPQRKKT
jgi:hypothetical protein